MCEIKFNPLEGFAKRGSGFQNGKEKIKKFFQENQNVKERAEILKNAYEPGSLGAMQCMFQAASFQEARYFIENLLEV